MDINFQNNKIRTSFKALAADNAPTTANNASIPVDYNNIPASSQAYSAAKTNALYNYSNNYREIGTFKVPFYDKGKIYRLNNGQKVVIIPKPGPTTINTFVKVGSFNEPEKIKGISHFIEHNLFNGSKNLAPDDFERIAHQLGAENNAGTCSMSTNYYLMSPLHSKGDLEQMVFIHADMLKNPAFLIDQIEKEKGPVISEIQMYEDDPYSKTNNIMLRNLFNIKSNAKDLVGGSEDSVGGLTRQDVLDYYKKWYTPDNMTTVIVGEVNPEQAIKLVASNFDTPAPDQTNNTGKTSEDLSNPLQKTKRVDFSSPDVNSVIMSTGFIGPKNNDIWDSFVVDALTTALTGYDNARLTKALKPFNTAASAARTPVSPNYNDPQVIEVQSYFNPGDEEQGLKTMYSVLYDMSINPVSQKDMIIIKNKLKQAFMESSELSMNIATMVGSSMVDHGDLRAYTDIPEMIDRLTAQDIQMAARKYLDLNKASVIVAHPQAQTTSAQPVSFKSKSAKHSAISFGSSLEKVNIGRIDEYNLANNIHAVINDNPASIKTNAVIELKADNIANIKPGTAEVLSWILNEGTRFKSKEQLSEYADINNINIKSYADCNCIGVVANTSPENLRNTLSLMKEILLSPDFTEEKLKKAKEEIKLEILSLRSDPKNAGNQELFGDHPFGNTPKKILENIDKLTMQDIIGFYNYLMTNSQGLTTISGPISKYPNSAEEIFSSLQRDLPLVQPYHYSNTYASQPLLNTKVIAEAEDRNQAHIVQMFKIKESGNIKDDTALTLLNEILGGSSQSRLFLDLREKQKLAYRVNSNYSNNRMAGVLALEIKTSTRNFANGKTIPQYENIQKSLDSFRKHIDNLINYTVSDEELNNAKVAVKSRILFDIESGSGKAGLVKTSFGTPYGASYIKEVFNAIDKMTPLDIQKAANAYLKQPSVISLIASKDTIDNTAGYLSTLGDFKKV